MTEAIHLINGIGETPKPDSNMNDIKMTPRVVQNAETQTLVNGNVEFESKLNGINGEVSHMSNYDFFLRIFKIEVADLKLILLSVSNHVVLSPKH